MLEFIFYLLTSGNKASSLNVAALLSFSYGLHRDLTLISQRRPGGDLKDVVMLFGHVILVSIDLHILAADIYPNDDTTP